MPTKIHGNQIQLGTIPIAAISGDIGGGGGGGGSGSTFNGLVSPIGFQAMSEDPITSGVKSTHYVGTTGFIQGWSCYADVSGTCQISVDKLNSAGVSTSMIGTGVVPGLNNAVFASGSNFTGWSSTGVVLGDRIVLGVSNISGQIRDLTFNLLIRNI
jgi:hypothetical protein